MTQDTTLRANTLTQLSSREQFVRIDGRRLAAR
jgi:hypothetical protein